jgi:hypothetical protein
LQAVGQQAPDGRDGRELAREAQNASAFCHRDSLYSLVAIGFPTPDTADAVLAYSLRLIDATTPRATGGVMPNFGAGNDLRPGEFRYDPETLTRLQSLSAEHDPSGVLRVVATSTPRRRPPELGARGCLLGRCHRHCLPPRRSLTTTFRPAGSFVVVVSKLAFFSTMTS